MSSNKDCLSCNGRGYNMQTRMVQDVAMGLALGVGLGVGFMPRYRSESYQETCFRCSGSGKERY